MTDVVNLHRIQITDDPQMSLLNEMSQHHVDEMRPVVTCLATGVRSGREAMLWFRLSRSLVLAGCTWFRRSVVSSLMSDDSFTVSPLASTFLAASVDSS